MPKEFGQLYEHMEQKVIKKRLRRKAGLVAKDPLTQKSVDVGTTGFADDVAETKLANDVESLKNEIATSHWKWRMLLKKRECHKILTKQCTCCMWLVLGQLRQSERLQHGASSRNWVGWSPRTGICKM